MDPQGVGWDEAGGSDAMALAESRFDGALVVSAGLVQLLGAAYNPSSNLRDLVFLYGTPQGSLIPGEINYITGAPASGLPEPSGLGLALLALAFTTARTSRAESTRP
jgi:hypothetical protein